MKPYYHIITTGCYSINSNGELIFNQIPNQSCYGIGCHGKDNTLIII